MTREKQQASSHHQQAISRPWGPWSAESGALSRYHQTLSRLKKREVVRHPTPSGTWVPLAVVSRRGI